jgi:UDP-glucose 4-epimerase
MSILLTGGTGYIGSHTAVSLINAGYDVIIADNLSNSKVEVLNRIEEITKTRPRFYKVDILDKEELTKIFQKEEVEAVIHFAGYKAVGESVEKPLMYYYNNVMNTIVLCEVMKEQNVKKIVFSSSATVYGLDNPFPYVETMPLSANSPYGRTKLMIEHILNDLYVSDQKWGIALLRYFNPIGAHESGRIGEDPNGIPNNLMPYITQVAVGKREELSVFGNDYNTKDGTGVRDYIHVMDLAEGHLKALEKLFEAGPMIEAYNLGTESGYSVLDVVNAFEEANGIKIKYRIAPRRPGDIDEYYANAEKAHRELGWYAVKSLVDMCRDSWKWQKNNPGGYE